MKENEIKKNIEEATRIFKETLEKSYLENKKPFYGIGIHRYLSFLTGKCNIQRKNNGNLRISGELPNLIFKEKCKGLPNTFADYNIVPIVITLFQIPAKND